MTRSSDIDPKASTVDGEEVLSPREARPSRVGRYRVLDRLGEGGMGVVYEALDPDLGRSVAIKLLRPERQGSYGRLRALREAQAMARLSHPNVVPVFDVGEVEHGVFVAMELVDGPTLRQWLRDERRSPAEIVRIFVAAGRGLQAAHRAGIVHRDFKPDNVLIGSDGTVKVADFGLARGCNDSASNESESSSQGPTTASLTATGGVVGTLRYMSPEQRVGEPAGAASDQYSFCVALYEALYGRTPRSSDRRSLQGRRDRWHFRGRVAGVLARGLCSDPDRRFASMGQLLARLDPGSVAWRLASVGALSAVTAGMVSGFVAWNANAEADPCENRDATMGGAWTGAREAELTLALDASPLTREAGQLAVARLDQYVRDWRDADEALCHAHRRVVIADGQHDAAMACLELRRVAFAGVVERLADGPDASSTELVAKLPPLDCADRLELVLPRTEQERVAVERLRAMAVRAEVRHHAGDVDGALELLARARAKADSGSFGPLEPELALVSGRLAMDRRDWRQAYADLETAWTVGVREGVERVAAEAVARAIFVRAMDSGDLDTALTLHQAADALIRRIGSPSALTALAANNVGVVYGMRGEMQRARRNFARAVELSRNDPGTSVVDRSGYSINLAIHTGDPTERDAIFVRAQQLVRGGLGESHPRYDEISLLRARHHPDPGTVRRLLASTCPRLRTSPSASVEQHHRCLYRLAQVHDQLGERRRAIVAANEAVAVLAGQSEDDRYLMARRDMASAYVALLSERFEETVEWVARARTKLAAHAELPWIEEELAALEELERRSHSRRMPNESSQR